MRMDAASLSSDDLAFAQGHVRIISGLYGILRPLDRMHPYRLEMGLKWPITPKKKNLYHYWEDRLADHIVGAANGCLINLASNEYSKAILRKDSPVRVITPQFKDEVKGEFKSLMTSRNSLAWAMHSMRVYPLTMTGSSLEKKQLNPHDYFQISADCSLHGSRVFILFN